MTKRALITGITGQDGSYLAELLLSKGYEVHGVIRKASAFNTGRIDHIYQDPHDDAARLFLHYGDVGHLEQITNLVYTIRPDEVYNLAAQSHVKVSFEMPEYTGEITGLGVTRLLEAIHRSGVAPRCYQASSSELFGGSPAPQSERTPFYPRSPYAAAKAYGYWMTVNYRESYGLFASNGILFNHESPRRGETFVTRKITRAVANIAAGRQQKLYLGNLDARRDWGYAPEYVEAMWLMMQHAVPDDFVIGTGQAHTIREFVEAAFGYAGLDWGKHVEVDSRYFRPTEVEHLCADAGKALQDLGWAPRIEFLDLVRVMVDADLEAIGMEPVGEGRKTLAEKIEGWHNWDSGITGALNSKSRWTDDAISAV